MADAVATSHDKHQRPTKKRALSPNSKQAASVDALFANPSSALSEPKNRDARGPPAPPEIVSNVQGSSAGAGSGEFHVYKASRRREYERLRVMDEESKAIEEDEAYEREREERKRKDEERTAKNRKRREKGRKGGGKGKVEGKVGGLKANGVGDVGIKEGDGGKKGEEGDDQVAMVVEEQGITFNDDD